MDLLNLVTLSFDSVNIYFFYFNYLSPFSLFSLPLTLELLLGRFWISWIDSLLLWGFSSYFSISLYSCLTFKRFPQLYVTIFYLFNENLDQVSANYGTDKSNNDAVGSSGANKVKLLKLKEHIHAYLFMHCLWMLSFINGRVERL